MPQPRSAQVCLSDTPFYHCISRCVRQSFLCGTDTNTGKCYEHRRGWVEKRLFELADVFAIDLCAYAVMHNHTHVVLHVDRDKALNWSCAEVLRRWHKLYKGTSQTQHYVEAELRAKMSPEQVVAVEEKAEQLRLRLYDISWFMRSLNENIARAANREDGCSGRFWEGRFKSQALLDDQALISGMVYVDLNPVRANIADSLSSSEYTSIKHRIRFALAKQQPSFLMPFNAGTDGEGEKCLPFSLSHYTELVEITGRSIIDAKKGHLKTILTPILTRLKLGSESWLKLTQKLESCFGYAVGKEQRLLLLKKRKGLKRMRGLPSARVLMQDI